MSIFDNPIFSTGGAKIPVPTTVSTSQMSDPLWVCAKIVSTLFGVSVKDFLDHANSDFLYGFSGKRIKDQHLEFLTEDMWTSIVKKATQETRESRTWMILCDEYVFRADRDTFGTCKEILHNKNGWDKVVIRYKFASPEQAAVEAVRYYTRPQRDKTKCSVFWNGGSNGSNESSKRSNEIKLPSLQKTINTEKFWGKMITLEDIESRLW